MAGHHHSSSFSSSTNSDDTVVADGLFAHHRFQALEKVSQTASSMAHRTSAATHWARVSLGRLSISRRPTRLIISLLVALCIIFSFYHASFETWWPAAATDFDMRGHHIPNKIWQVMFTPPNVDQDTGRELYDFEPTEIPYTSSWLAKNPDYNYHMITTTDANDFVLRHFPGDQKLLDVHFGLRNHGPRSDLMRYLLMYIEGGVYSDTDVTCLKPIDTWIPLQWRDRVKAVVGIEGDSLGGPVIGGMLWDVQFGQWTVAAVPRHRLFRKMIDSVVERVGDLCERKGTPVDKLAMTAIEIMNSTATALWSETIFKELQLISAGSDEPLEDFSDLSGMTEPRLYDDILVLPIDYIGSGVPHSNATEDIPSVAIVRHHFSGSWRNGEGTE